MSSFRKTQREDARNIQANREKNYANHTRQILTHHISERLSPPPPTATHALNEALSATQQDPYGDGDQSPLPDEATRRHIATVARSRYEAVCMREDASEPLRTAWKSQLTTMEGLFPNGQQNNMFHFSCFMGDIRAVRHFIEQARAQVRRAVPDALTHLLEERLSTLRMTPLHYCAMGSKDIRAIEDGADYLLQFNWVADTLCAEGARVDSRDLVGCTPLGVATGMAATYASAELVDVLLQYGADPYVELRFGHQIVSGCIATNNTFIFRKLLQAGVDLARNDSTLLSVVWQSPSLLQVVLEVQRERLLKLETCASCGKGGASKFCSACRNVFYCSPECQKKDWRSGHKKVCGKTSSDHFVEVDAKKMAFSEICPSMPRWGLVNPVTGVCPRRQMRPKEGVAFMVKMTWVLAMEEMRGETEYEPFLGCVKLDEKNGDFLLLKKEGSMQEMHEKLRKYLREKSGGFGMVYILARWKDKRVLQLDLSRPLPPPKTWW